MLGLPKTPVQARILWSGLQSFHSATPRPSPDPTKQPADDDPLSDQGEANGDQEMPDANKQQGEQQGISDPADPRPAPGEVQERAQPGDDQVKAGDGEEPEEPEEPLDSILEFIPEEQEQEPHLTPVFPRATLLLAAALAVARRHTNETLRNIHTQLGGPGQGTYAPGAGQGSL